MRIIAEDKDFIQVEYNYGIKICYSKARLFHNPKRLTSYKIEIFDFGEEKSNKDTHLICNKLKTYELKYFYLATGMEGIAQEFPKKQIKAENRNKALYLYHRSNGLFKDDSFEDFMKLHQSTREWATTVKEL